MISPMFLAVFLSGTLLVFSQFGARLNARSSITWWALFLFLFTLLFFPQFAIQLSDFFGFQVPSNFVFTLLIGFLLLQMVQITSHHTLTQRKLRLLNSRASFSHLDLTTYAGTEALIVLPTFNEEDQIQSMIEALNQLQANHPQYRYLFVDDGSTDGTRSLLKKYAAQQFVSHHCNQGVSGGILTGVLVAQEIGASYVIQCDSDGQHPVSKIHDLIQCAKTTQSALVVGSRFLPENQTSDQSTTRLRRTGSMFLSTFLKMFSWNQTIHDPTSGFRVYSKESFSLLSRYMPDEYPEPETLALFLSKNLKVSEYPVLMNARTTGSSSLNGWAGIRFMLKVSAALFGLRIRMWFQSS